MPTRVVVVDGHTLTRFGLTGLLSEQADLDVAGEAESITQARRIVGAVRPDVVTVDARLPDGDGIALARELRDRYPDLGIVVLTSHGEDDILFRALENGASAFVAKTAPTLEVLAAIRHASVAASSFTASGLADALARKHDAASRYALSPREAEVLRLLGDGLSIPAIARSMFVSHSTAKTYVARIYDKLGASNRTQAIMTAMRAGLIRHDSATLTAS